MPSQVFEYSTARFLEQFFYNNKLYKRRGILQCQCWPDKNQILKNNSLIFEIDELIEVRMDYQQKEKYDIQMLKP